MSLKNASKNTKDSLVAAETIDASTYSEEFTAFVQFVGQHHSSEKNELSYFLYPFYVYVYLILFFHEKINEAKTFLNLNKQMFLQAKGYATKIDQLAKFQSIDEVWSDGYFFQFSKRKYVVKASKDCVDYLKSYLEESESVVLASILNSYICFENAEKVSPEKNTDLEKNLETVYDNRKQYCEKVDSENPKDCLPKPNHLVLDLSCGKANVCCVDIDFKSNLLACGLSNSSIQIWNLENSSLKYNKSVHSALTQKLSSQRSRRLLTDHEGPVYSLAFAPNNLLISSSEDGSIQTWCTKDFKLISTYQDTTFPVWDVAVSLKNPYFATSSLDAVVRLWHFDKNTPVRQFTGHTESVDCICFHPNSQYIASGSADKTLRLWTTQDGRSVREFVGHHSSINCIAYSHDGKHLASADDAGYIIIWDIGSATKLHSSQIHNDRIFSISYSKDDSMLASGSISGLSKVLDVRRFSDSKADEKKKKHCEIPLVDCQNLNSAIHFVSFHQDDVLLSVCSSYK